MQRLSVGFSVAPLTTYEPGTMMLGWGASYNRVKGVAESLSVRAAYFRDPANGRSFAYVCVDLCFISSLLRARVLAQLQGRHAELGLDTHGLMLTATHTHSGPSGYSDHLLYSICAPGIFTHVIQALTGSIVDAIVAAADGARPADLFYHAEAFPLSTRIAFNRSLKAYNQNLDVKPLGRGRADEAVDRTMRLLLVQDPTTSRAMGCICWFGLHATSIHGDNERLHPDHKGLAAMALERTLRGRPEEALPTFVAIFAQEAAGDVTPNYRFDATRGFTVGHLGDDLADAHRAAQVQAGHALGLLRHARHTRPLGGTLGSRTDMQTLAHRPVEVDGELRRFVGHARTRTSPAVLGLPMTFGTREGPGPLGPLRGTLQPLLRVWGSNRRRHRKDPKFAVLELGSNRERRFFNAFDMNESMLRELGTFIFGHHVTAREMFGDDVCESAWAPETLPVQIARIGEIVLCGLPVEPTTVAGRRLRRDILQALRSRDAIINGYANDYAQYLTTPEEYTLQRYEGACTLFGPWSLLAWRDIACEIAGALADDVSPPADGPTRPAPPTR
ncbi:MAG: neutral/alkaline non-lysosomal ceramidase N-terminal domain-containing protein [Myxococcota bacterium]